MTTWGVDALHGLPAREKPAARPTVEALHVREPQHKHAQGDIGVSSRINDLDRPEGKEFAAWTDGQLRTLRGTQFLLYALAKRGQKLDACIVQLTRPIINEAQRACATAIRQTQREASIEADAGCTRDHRVIGKPVVEQRVGYNEWSPARDHVTAERRLARGMTQLGQTAGGFNPLPFSVNHSYECDGHIEERGCPTRQLVHPLAGFAVDDL